MQGIGYKELIPAAMGQDDVNRAVWDIIVHTRHYACLLYTSRCV